MFSSSYYYNQYTFYVGEEKKFGKWLEQLRNIQDSFSDRRLNQCDNDVNSKISSCRSDMALALKGSGRFTSNLSPLDSAKEPQPLNDGDISGAKGKIDAEVTRITQKLQEATSKRSDNWNMYLQAKAKEAASC